MNSRKEAVSIFLILILSVVSALTTGAYHALRSDWVLFRKGEGYFQCREYSKAIPIYIGLLQRGFESPSAYLHLEKSLLASGELAGALSTLELVVRGEPKNLRALSLLAGLYAQTGRFEKAIVSYQMLLLAQPYDQHARIHLARLLSWQGRYEEAVVEYRKVLGEQK